VPQPEPKPGEKDYPAKTGRNGRKSSDGDSRKQQPADAAADIAKLAGDECQGKRNGKIIAGHVGAEEGQGEPRVISWRQRAKAVSAIVEQPGSAARDKSYQAQDSLDADERGRSEPREESAPELHFAVDRPYRHRGEAD